jgi:hypothetical protein
MSSRTRTPVICECGHTGFELLKENDQPFSGLWEQYSLEGFGGSTVTITSYADMPANILTAMNPKCPQCGCTGKVRYY